MRKRFTTKSGLVASSDFTRTKSHRASLALAHENFKNSSYCLELNSKPFTRTEPEPNTLVKCRIFGKEQIMPYYRVKAAGFEWTY